MDKSRIKYKICNIEDLSLKQIRRLYDLTLNGRSDMTLLLESEARLDKGSCYDPLLVSIAIYNKSKFDNPIIAWASIEEPKEGIDDPFCCDLNVFVDPVYRRLGIGTKLIKLLVKNNTSKSNVFSAYTGDGLSYNFYVNIFKERKTDGFVSFFHAKDLL